MIAIRGVGSYGLLSVLTVSAPSALPLPLLLLLLLCLCSSVTMSSLSRAEEIKMRRAAAQAAEKAKRLEAAAAAAGVVLDSTLDQSMKRNILIVHNPDDLVEELNRVFEGGWEEEVVKYDVEEEMIDRDFLDHDVEEPPRVNKKLFTTEEGKFKKTAGEDLFNLCKRWQQAFDDLEQKFIKRAAYAHDLRLAFDLKRKELKVAVAKQETKSTSVRAADSSSSSSSSSAPKGKCGCKTKCISPNCGCRRSRLGCSLACGCGGGDGCLNARTHSDTPEGLETFTKAVTGANSKNVLKKREANVKKEEEMEEE